MKQKLKRKKKEENWSRMVLLLWLKFWSLEWIEGV